MSLLQYTSNEMYSSTELIRKSKGIFDKLTKKEIEKAIILRDGKPSFMLLEFNKYEDLITEYLALKDEVENYKKKVKEQKKVVEENKTTIENIESEIQNDVTEVEDIDEDELEKALAKIEQMDIEIDPSINEKPSSEEVAQNIKEFWD